jgi:hypothetical protein
MWGTGNGELEEKNKKFRIREMEEESQTKDLRSRKVSVDPQITHTQGH